jgi:isopenicillin N synthase-like dioxygenase
VASPLDDPIPMTLAARNPGAFAARLGAAFVRYGFATVSEHGIPDTVVAEANRCAITFFALPEAAKRRYHVAGGAGQRGYTPFGVETAKGAARSDLKEFWHTGRELPPGHRLTGAMPPNLWPVEIPAFRTSVYALYEALDGLGLRILAGIARHLALPPEFFDDSVHMGNSVLRLLHYPPVAGPTEHVRAAAHEDINAITVLLGADEAGLELLDRDGTWLPVNPPPGSAVLNIGDMLARHTNGVLPSTSHRVVNPAPERAGASRYSTPFFLHYRPDFLIETIPSCITAEKPNRYPVPITANAFLGQRLAEIKLK